MKDSFLRSSLNLLMLVTSFSMMIIFYFAAVDFGYYDSELWWVWRLVQMFAPILIAYLMTIVCVRLAGCIKDEETAKVQELRPLEAQIVPTFIGMFVISFELVGMAADLAVWVLIMLFGFWCIFSRVSYYSPLLSLMGYRFYEAKVFCGGTVYITLITKRRDLKKGLELSKLKRINNYTYMEV